MPGGFAVNENGPSVTEVTSVHAIVAKDTMSPKEVHRGKNHSHQPIRVSAIFCRVRSTPSIPLV
jgi:hypothetical protein